MYCHFVQEITVKSEQKPAIVSKDYSLQMKNPPQLMQNRLSHKNKTSKLPPLGESLLTD